MVNYSEFAPFGIYGKPEVPYTRVPAEYASWCEVKCDKSPEDDWVSPSEIIIALEEMIGAQSQETSNG